MKFHLRKISTLFFLSLIIVLGFSCSPAKQAGSNMPRKSHKGCNCPKWTNKSLDIKHFTKTYA